MADFKRIIQRTTNSERVETGVADLQPNEICIVEDGEELIYKDRNGKYISVSKDKYKVNTIEELKKSKKYKIGDVVEVLGYYTPGDGGGHPRKKMPTGYVGADSTIGEDGSIWGIVHSGEINVSWFGAKGDGIANDTEFIKNCIRFCSGFYLDKNIYTEEEVNEMVIKSRNSENNFKIYFNGIHLIKETLFITSNIEVYGDSRNIYNINHGSSLLFDLPSYDMICVSTAFLKKNADNTYTLPDTMDIPNGDDFDNGNYVPLSYGSKIGFYINSKNNVKVGLKIFQPDFSTSNMRIGHHIKCTIDIGWIASANWCSTHHNPTVSARCNGYYIFSANGGATYYSPVCNMEKVDVNPTLDCIIKPTSIDNEFVGSIAYYYDNSIPIMYAPLSDGGVALHHCIDNSSCPTLESPYCETTGGYGVYSIALLNRSNLVFSGGSTFFNLPENASSPTNKSIRGNPNACTFRIDGCFGRRIDLSKFTRHNANKLFKVTNSNVKIQIGGVITGGFDLDLNLDLGEGIENVEFLDTINVLKIEETGNDSKGLFPYSLDRAIYLSQKFDASTIQLKKDVSLTQDCTIYNNLNITSDGILRTIDFANKKINLYNNISFTSVNIIYTAEFLQSFKDITVDFISTTKINSGDSYIIGITTNSSAKLNFDKDCDFSHQTIGTHISRAGVIASDCILNISTSKFPKYQYSYFGNIKGGKINRFDDI